MTKPSLLSYQAPYLFNNCHVQNILSSGGIRKLVLKHRHRFFLRNSQQLILNTPDNVRLMAELNCHEQQSGSLIILIHGWEGSSQSAYLLSMAAKLYQAGHDTLRLHLRDHGETTHLNREIFNSSMIEEVVASISDFQKRYSYEKYQLVGFSLGGNFALRVGLHAHLLAQPIHKLMAICPVLDPEKAMIAMNTTLRFYDHYFTKKWKNSLTKKAHNFPEYRYLPDLKNMRRLDDMNAYFIPRYTPFKNLPDYYQSYTLTGDCLSKMKIPSLIIASKDDPIIPVEDYKRTDLVANTKLEITHHGGHCAYLENWKLDSWLDKRADAFFA